MSEKKLDLIAQLLAKAERTTPEEAEALTEAAERLMLKYGIDQAVIDARRARAGQAREKTIEAAHIITGTYARDLLDLGSDVVHGLGSMRALQSTIPGGKVLYIVGFESDVQQAQRLVASLELQAIVAMRTWWRGERDDYEWYPESDKRRVRGGFIRGFGAGARQRIEDNKQRIVRESGAGTELALVDRAQAVDAAMDDMYPMLGRARARRDPDLAGYYGGHAAGLEANTGERVVTPGRGLPAGVTR